MIGLILAGTALGQEVGAIVRPEAAIDLAADRDGEDLAAMRTRVRAFARGETGDDGTWFLEVRALNEILVGDDVEGAWLPSVGESGWEGPLGGPFRLRVGHLVERWGKLDFLPLIDVLNGRDLRYGPTTPQVWQRLPAPMAIVTVGSDRVRSETTYLPFASADAFSLRETDWSFVRQGMMQRQARIVQEWPGDAQTLFGEAMPIAQNALTELDPTFRRGLDQASTVRNMPQALWYNGEIAERLAFEGDGFDAALVGAWIRNRQAQSRLDPFIASLLQDERVPNTNETAMAIEGLVGLLDVQWPRTFVAGGEVNTVVDAFGLRAEAVWFSDKTLRTRWMGATTSPYVGAGVGIDYTRGSWLFASIEARVERYLAVPERPLLLVAEDNLQIAGGLRLTGASDRLTATLGGSYDVAFGEYLARPTLQWRASDAVELSIGAAILGGETPPPRSLIDALTYRGGPASYWSQNDVATVGVAWIL